MKKTILLLAVMTLAVSTSFAVAQEAKPANSSSAKGEKPKASPGWIVVEEDWYLPLRYDSLVALDNARMHYRNKEEKGAASELRKAITWLKFAESHALPVTKSKLTATVSELTSLASDLESGKTFEAARMEMELGKASHALAEWHYFRAKDYFGKGDEKYAAEHLEAAVAHLQHAANSAHYEYGPDTVTVFDSIAENGWLITESKDVDHNILGKHLDVVEKAVKEMGDTLMKVAK